MSSTSYTDLQLDALRELANVGSGNAGTALSGLLGRPVDLDVPSVRVLALADAVDAAGPAESEATAVLLPVGGDLEALVLLLLGPEDADAACRLLGVELGGELAVSAIGEIGNILGASYTGALATLAGLDLWPGTPQVAADMLGAIVASVMAAGAGPGDVAIVLDSNLRVEGEACSLSFLLVPAPGGVDDLLGRLGLG